MKKLMTYTEAIAKLGLSQLGAARFLKIGDRTSRRYASDHTIPHGILLLLNEMVDNETTPEDIQKKYR